MHCACVLCVSPRSRPLSFNQETRVSSTLGTILISRQQKGEGGANADVCLHGGGAFKKYDFDVELLSAILALGRSLRQFLDNFTW